MTFGRFRSPTSPGPEEPQRTILGPGDGEVAVVRLGLLSPDQTLVDAIYDYLDAHRAYGLSLAGTWATSLECLGHLQPGRYHVLLLDARLPDLDRRLLDTLRRKSGAGLVGLVPPDDAGKRAYLADAGVAQVLALTHPLDGDELVRAVHAADAERLQTQQPVRVEVRHKPEVRDYPDRVLAVWSAGGGVGKSTIASNLAAAIAFLAQEPTVLVDFCNTGPVQMRLFLNEDEIRERGQANLYRLAADLGPDPSDADLLEAIQRNLLRYRPRGVQGDLSLLLGPLFEQRWLDDAMARPGSFYQRLLLRLRQLARYVVVDVGQDVTLPAHEAALLTADAVLVVTTPSLQTVELLADKLPLLRQVVASPAKVRVVVNKVEPHVGVDIDSIRTLLDQPLLVGELPLASAEVERARLERTPAVLRLARNGEQSPFLQAVEALARRFAPVPERRRRALPLPFGR